MQRQFVLPLNFQLSDDLDKSFFIFLTFDSKEGNVLYLIYARKPVVLEILYVFKMGFLRPLTAYIS